MKTCSRCGVSQPLVNFAVRAASPDGLLASCKICSARDKKNQRARLRARPDAEIEAAAAARGPRACRKCKIVKDPAGFPRDRGRRDGRGTLCLTCAAAATKQYYSVADPEALRARRRASYKKNYASTTRPYKLKANFGLSVEQYDAMLESQGGGCAICAQPPNGKYLAVDHCHATGRVRGLLCANCNKGIGNLQDSPDLLRKAADYVEAHRLA